MLVRGAQADVIAFVNLDFLGSRMGCHRPGAGGESLNVMWSASSPEIGRYSPVVVRSSLEELEDRFVALRSIGGGYIEIALLAEGSPQVTLSFRGDHAVIHRVDDIAEEPRSFLLIGDGTLTPTGEVEVPVMDDPAVFTGDFVMTVDRAWDVVRDFARTGSPVGLGEWYELSKRVKAAASEEKYPFLP